MYVPEIGHRLTKGNRTVVVDFIEGGQVYFRVVGVEFARLPLDVFIAIVEAEQPTIA